MSTDRLTRVNELLKQEIASALYRVMNERKFDFSAVTVTRVVTSSDLHTARVMVSIRDHEKERARILRQLARHRGDIQQIIAKNVILKYTPHLEFELDPSIEQGDRVLSIITQMEAAAEPDEPPTHES